MKISVTLALAKINLSISVLLNLDSVWKHDQEYDRYYCPYVNHFGLVYLICSTLTYIQRPMFVFI